MTFLNIMTSFWMYIMKQPAVVFDATFIHLQFCYNTFFWVGYTAVQYRQKCLFGCTRLIQSWLIELGPWELWAPELGLGN